MSASSRPCVAVGSPKSKWLTGAVLTFVSLGSIFSARFNFKKSIMAPQSNEPVCCPPFHPQLWDDKMVEWHQKPFVRHLVRTLFYLPLNFGGVIRKVHKKNPCFGHRYSGLALFFRSCLPMANGYLPGRGQRSGGC